MLGYIFKSKIFRKNVRQIAPYFLKFGHGGVSAWRLAYSIVSMAKQKIDKSHDNLQTPVTSAKLLQTEKGKQYLESLKRQGVREEDFVEFWDTDPLTRQCYFELDNSERIAAFYMRLGNGLSKEDAAIEVKERYPLWGNIQEKHSSWPPDDLPLPIELFPRVHRALSRKELDWSGVSGKIYGSANAYIRHLIRNKLI